MFLTLLGALQIGGDPVASQRSTISTEVFRYECRTEATTSDLTLFANGTLRLREGPLDQRRLLLLELDPPQLSDLTARLENLDLRDADHFGGELEGEWLDQCRLLLELPGRPSEGLRFHRFDTLSLGLQTAVRLGEELAQRVRDRAPFDGLPASYEPKVGDYLRRADGELFEVMGFSADNRAVELAGLDQPIGIYVALESLHQVFVEHLLERP